MKAATKKASKKAAKKSTKKIVKATTKATVPAKVATVPNGQPEFAYRQGGGYHNSVLALRTLGVGKMHSFEKIIAAVVKAFGAEFKAFKSKGKRNDNGKDTNGRIIQNVSVCGRSDYGAPLKAVGYEVRFDGREKTAGLFKVGKSK